VRLSDRERRERLELLFERYYASVLGYALRRAPRAVAEDVASETFIVAFRRIEDVPAPALPWLYGVARRVLANERRAQSRRDQLDQRLRSVAHPAWMDGQDADIGDDKLAAIASLPEPEREAVMLTAWEGLSGAEAAAVAGCTRVAMRARLYRARRRLTELLATPDEGPTRELLAATAGEWSGAIDRRR
jgi:RNA polymerase sigma factor (sigma-70 family)